MKRRVQRLLVLLIIPACLLLLIAIVLQILNGDFFRLQVVYIAGSSDLLTDLVSVKSRQNLLLINEDKYKRDIKDKNPWVKNILISKQLPHTLRLVMEYRQPIAWVQIDDKITFIDSEGMVLGGDTYDTRPPIYLSCIAHAKIGLIIEDPQIKMILSLLTNLKDIDEALPQQISCEKDLITLGYEKTIVVMDYSKNAKEMAASLQLLFKQFRIDGQWPLRVNMTFSKPVLTFVENVASQSATPAAQSIN
ncbi:MAG: FtsQ-type POTRA domain-containing protein [Patescibacteria group bacterium]